MYEKQFALHWLCFSRSSCPEFMEFHPIDWSESPFHFVFAIKRKAWEKPLISLKLDWIERTLIYLIYFQ